MKLASVRVIAAVFAVAAIICFYRATSGAKPLTAIADYNLRAEAYLHQLRPQQFLIPVALLLGFICGSAGPIRRIVSRSRSHFTPQWLGAGEVLLYPAFFLWAAYTSYVKIGHTPRVFDGFNFFFQAANFVRGQLYAPVPQASDFFQFPFIMMYHGHWFGSVYPGHSLLLALGMLVGAPWLVNPLMGTLTLLQTSRLAKLIYGASTARIAVVLGLLSPFLLFQSAICMSHPTAAFFIVSAIIHLMKLARQTSGRSWQAVAGSCCWGFAIITRPQAALSVGLPFALFGLYSLLTKRLRLIHGLIIVAVVAAFQALLFLYNSAVTGDPLDNPRYRVSPYRRLGFGKDIGYPLPDGTFSGHTFMKGLDNTSVNLSLLNGELLGLGGGFAVGLPLVLWVAALWQRRNRTLFDWLAAGSIACTVALYVAYFTPSPNFGPRYYFEAAPLMLLLAAKGLIIVYQALDQFLRRLPIADVGHFMPAPALIGSLFFYGFSLLIARPMYVSHYTQLPPIADRARIEGLERLTNAIVLVDPMLFINNVFTWNSPNLDTPVIFAPDAKPEKLHELKEAFPLRMLFRLRWDYQQLSGSIVPLAPEGVKAP